MSSKMTGKSSSTTTATPLTITSFPANPLTTTFSDAPSSCSGLYNSFVYIVDPATSCLPSGFARNPSSFFSPGIACPSGYVTACHDTTGVSSITTVTCCPFRGDMTLSCVPSPWTLQQIWSTLFCTWTPPADGTSLDVTLSSNGVTSTTAVSFSGAEGFNALGVRMVYQTSDLVAASSSTSPKSTSVLQILVAYQQVRRQQ